MAWPCLTVQHVGTWSLPEQWKGSVPDRHTSLGHLSRQCGSRPAGRKVRSNNTTLKSRTEGKVTEDRAGWGHVALFTPAVCLKTGAAALDVTTRSRPWQEVTALRSASLSLVEKWQQLDPQFTVESKAASNNSRCQAYHLTERCSTLMTLHSPPARHNQHSTFYL